MVSSVLGAVVIFMSLPMMKMKILLIFSVSGRYSESEFEIEGHPRQMLVNAETGKAAVFSDIWVWSLPEAHPLRDLLGVEENGDWMWRVDMVSAQNGTTVSAPSQIQIQVNLDTANEHTRSTVDKKGRIAGIDMETGLQASARTKGIAAANHGQSHDHALLLEI